MTTRLPNRKWKLTQDSAGKVKELLLTRDGIDDSNLKSTYEVWQVRSREGTQNTVHSLLGIAALKMMLCW